VGLLLTPVSNVTQDFTSPEATAELSVQWATPPTLYEEPASKKSQSLSPKFSTQNLTQSVHAETNVGTKCLTAAVTQVANKVEIVVPTTKTQNVIESSQAKIAPTQQKDANSVKKEFRDSSAHNVLLGIISSTELAPVDVPKDTFPMIITRVLFRNSVTSKIVKNVTKTTKISAEPVRKERS